MREDQTLGKLFPQIKQKEYEFEMYEDYEEHLQILDIIEKNEKILKNDEDEVEKQQVRYKEETENIIIHDDDGF